MGSEEKKMIKSLKIGRRNIIREERFPVLKLGCALHSYRNSTAKSHNSVIKTSCASLTRLPFITFVLTSVSASGVGLRNLVNWKKKSGPLFIEVEDRNSTLKNQVREGML